MKQSGLPCPVRRRNEMDDNGCWTCGNLEGRVTSTATDDDGNRIRRRKCTQCGAIWLTEERRLARSVRWFQRADSQVEAQRQRRSRRRRVCRYCKGRYTAAYRTHLGSRTHLAWKARRAAERREYVRLDARWRYRTDPVYRQAQLDRHRTRAPDRVA